MGARPTSTAPTGLEQTLELMSGEERHRYSVAWLDLLADGARDGTRGRQPRRSARRPAQRAGRAGAAPRGRRRTRRALAARRRLRCPTAFRRGLLRRSGVRAFNALRWRAAPRRERGRPLALAPYFFPLDVLGEWNRLYGRGGLIQYQFVIPAGEEARAASAASS